MLSIRYLKNVDKIHPDWYCLHMDGFKNADTDALLVLRDNLLKGLDKVAEHLDAGTLDVSPGEKQNPPRAGGELTLMLLTVVNSVLDERGVAPKW